MGPVTVRIPNDIAAISIVQAGAAVYVRNAGFGEEVAWQTGLVLEENCGSGGFPRIRHVYGSAFPHQDP